MDFAGGNHCENVPSLPNTTASVQKEARWKELWIVNKGIWENTYKRLTGCN